MLHTFDSDYFRRTFETLVNTPSPVGYYEKANPLLSALGEELGYTVTFDNRSTAYITVEGRDNSKTVLVGAHMDTLGMVVRKIEDNGTLRVRQLGGVNYHSFEGETVTVHTRDGRSYTGLFACQSHSVHVFDDARTMARDEEHMMVILDEKVSAKEEVTALGIRNGDVISVDPRCQFTENGFLKSRFIDDKAAVALCFTLLRSMQEKNLVPQYRTIFAFPYLEEIGLGGTYVPAEVSEFVSVDIGLIGPELEGNEYSVSICSKDASTIYDYELTSRLISIAEQQGLKYAVDVFYHYGSDANAALKAGHDLKAAIFGAAVYCSHGMERTHMEGVENTYGLLSGYVLGVE